MKKYFLILISLFLALTVVNWVILCQNDDITTISCRHPIREIATKDLVLFTNPEESKFIVFHQYYIKSPYRLIYFNKFEVSEDKTLSIIKGKECLNLDQLDSVKIFHNGVYIINNCFVNLKGTPDSLIFMRNTFIPCLNYCNKVDKIISRRWKYSVTLGPFIEVLY